MKPTFKPLALLGLAALLAMVPFSARAESTSKTLSTEATPAIDRSEPANRLPLLIEDAEGKVFMSQVVLEGDLFRQLSLLLAGSCNGGSCSPIEGGPALKCPTSGGPDCGSGEACQCYCDGGSTRNECVELELAF